MTTLTDPNPSVDHHQHVFAVEHGEPVLLLRGNDRNAVKVIQHYLAIMSVDPAVPATELERLAHVADAMRDWQTKKGLR